MQIIINEDEILEAIKGYIAGQGIVTAGREITVELTAGRGPNGSRATVEITKPDGTSTVHEVFASDEEKAVEADITHVEEVVEKAAKEKPVPKADPKPAPAPEPEPPVKDETGPVDPDEPNADTTSPFELPEVDAPTEVIPETIGGDSLFEY